MAEYAISVDGLERFCTTVLMKGGLNKQSAVVVAESLLFADLRGIDSHGVVRLPTYLERIESGVMNLNSELRIERESPGSALLDAQNGFGQIAGSKAMAIAMEKARSNGIATVGVKNSNHFGVAAFFAMKALREDMIGVVMTNASPAIAPYRSKDPLVGTNPLAVAVPAAKGSIVLDMAASVVARGKIRLASLSGEKIPMDWALDRDGKPTDDPGSALKGSMAPIGGPKGAGLSLVFDLLCGVLTGSSLTGEVKNITDMSGPSKTGHMFIAIDIAKFDSVEKFKERINRIVLRIKALPSVDGGPIYLPGEIELDLEKQRRVQGIPLSSEVIATLGELAERYGVPKSWEAA